MDGFWQRNREYITGLLAVAIVSGAYMLVQRWPTPEPIQIVFPSAAVQAPTLEATTPPIVVHVVGAVRSPGVYTLPAGSRLYDAVQAAGGTLDEADLARINLADLAHDTQQIYVPLRGEIPPASPTPGEGPEALATPLGRESGLVNINTATAEELEELPGIGPAYAARIVAYREEKGPFGRPEDIMEVSGIGPARYEQIRDLITTR